MKITLINLFLISIELKGALDQNPVPFYEDEIKYTKLPIESIA